MAIDQTRNWSIKKLIEKQDLLNEYTIAGWKGRLTPSHFATQIIAEADELLGSGVQYKWWKATDPSSFDLWNVKIEAIDIVHFYLSMMILWNEAEYDAYVGPCTVGSKSYDQYRDTYIGADQAVPYLRGGMIEGVNQLDHSVFAGIITELLTGYGDFYAHVKALNGLVSSVGLNCEEFSAIYSAKSKLNEFRASQGYQDGTYVKVQDGLEDNERLEPLVQAFLDDKSMTLEQLRTNVEDAFYELST